MNFWQGIVEDNTSDPKKLGRVKVRIFGKHTECKEYDENNNKYSVDDLPYAYPINPITSPSISNEGFFSIPQQGSIVVGFYFDPQEQTPMYFGTIPKLLTETPNFEKGFTDPKQEYPKEEYKNEIGYNRLAAGIEVDKTIVKIKNDSVETGIDCGNGVSFTEPNTQFNPDYPNNKVMQTSSGHIIEIDDSSGSERIQIYHKSGSFDEFYPDGKRVEKNQKEKIEIDLSDKNILIKGNNKVKIEGSRNVHIVGDDKKEIDGNIKIDVTGQADLTITGTINITGKADINVLSTADTNITSNSNVNVTASGNAHIQASSINIDSLGNSAMTGTGIQINASSNVKLNAPLVEFN